MVAIAKCKYHNFPHRLRYHAGRDIDDIDRSIILDVRDIRREKLCLECI